jgi:hypothetical protein
MAEEESPIIIAPQDVRINTDSDHTYTSETDPFTLRGTKEKVQDRVKNPDFRAIELCAGDGPITNMLVTELGVSKHQVLCVDKARPPHPLVDGVQWMFIHLDNLAKAILAGQELPPDILALEGKFDLVTLHYAVTVFRVPDKETKIKRGKAVTHFFAKEDAIIDYAGSGSGYED